ncbi:armadillo repeat-containing protein 5-like [Mustelus asterias]
MRLALDGGARLPASRAHLSRGSEVFRAMLGGSYLESRQSEVPLGGVGAEEAEVLLHHLHGCRAVSGCARLAVLGEKEEEGDLFEDSLLGRALAAAGQYLLSDLTPGLERAAYRRCTPGRLPALCRFARHHHLPGLRALCLRGLLEAPMGPRERARAWQRLAAGAGEREDLLPTLRGLLLEHV